MFDTQQERHRQELRALLDEGQIARVVQEIEENNALYVLDVGDERYVLFRIDGLSIDLGPILFRFLSWPDDTSVEDRAWALSREHGPGPVARCLESLLEATTQGRVFDAPPRLVRPDPHAVQPGGILILVTQTCNLRCTYCYAGDGSYGGVNKLLPSRDARRAIDLMLDRAPERNTFSVTFFGGEPLLNWQLMRDVVDYCESRATVDESRELRFSYNVTTNGTIFNDEICALLRDYRFSVMVSFDGSEQAANRPFADGRSSYDVVVGNVKRMAAAGLNFELRGTMASGRQAQEASVQEFVQLGRALGATRAFLAPADEVKSENVGPNSLHPLTNGDLADVRTTYERVALENLDLARRGVDQRALLDPYFGLAKSLATGQAVGMGRCGAGYGMVATSTDGHLYPCHRFVGMEEYRVGSVRDGVDDEKVAEFFRAADAASEPECEKCMARLVCGGFCFYHVADGKGGFTPPEETECEGVRDGLRFSIRLMMEMKDLDPEAAGQYTRNMRSL